jgi:hypothetical protein
MLAGQTGPKKRALSGALGWSSARRVRNERKLANVLLILFGSRGSMLPTPLAPVDFVAADSRKRSYRIPLHHAGLQRLPTEADVAALAP